MSLARVPDIPYDTPEKQYLLQRLLIALTRGLRTTGSWTATDGSGAGLSLTTADTKWVRVGPMVYAYFAITYPTTADATAAKVSGLPFSSVASTNDVHPVAIGFQDSTKNISGVVKQGASTFVFYDESGVAITNADLSTKIIRGTAIYFGQD